MIAGTSSLKCHWRFFTWQKQFSSSFVPHLSKDLVVSDPLYIGDIALSYVTAFLSCPWGFVAGWCRRQWRGCGRAGGCWRRCCGAVQRCPRDTNPPLPRTALWREMQVGWWDLGTFAWWEIMGLDNFASWSVKLVSCIFIFNIIKAAFCKPNFTVTQILLEAVSLFC